MFIRPTYSYLIKKRKEVTVMWTAYKKFWKDALHLEKTATRAEFWWGVLGLLLTEAILWGDISRLLRACRTWKYQRGY